MISDSISSSYATILYKVDPIAFSMGFLKVHWYSLMYIVAFLVVYTLLLYRVRKKEAVYEISLISDFLIYAVAGVLIGGRLGYVLIYNFSYYSQNLLEIIVPLKISCFFIHNSCFTYTGFYGMSYHGGLIGVLLAALYFTRRNKIDFWRWADFAVPAVPAGFFFGRIGNFLNGELYGRVTFGWWGMYFPADQTGALRHPSQLYEAFFEGAVLFAVLWLLRNRLPPPVPSIEKGRGTLSQRERGIWKEGSLLCIYIFFYGAFRFLIEFFREPDPQLGFVLAGLTLGQIFSLIMALFPVLAAIYPHTHNNYARKR